MKIRKIYVSTSVSECYYDHFFDNSHAIFIFLLSLSSIVAHGSINVDKIYYALKM